MVTVWGSASGLTLYSFLSPSETIASEKYAQQIDEMYWKLQHLQLVLVNRMGPDLLHAIPDSMSHNQCFKGWTNWATNFCLICQIHLISCQQTTTSSSTSTTFCREKCFHNQQETENAFQEFTESWRMDFCNTEINQLISYWKKRVDYNGSYFN